MANLLPDFGPSLSLVQKSHTVFSYLSAPFPFASKKEALHFIFSAP